MSQSAYLPGPWQIHYHHERYCFRICTKEGTTILELPVQEDEEWRNTLHLLAAAPKLYEALRELLTSQEEALLKDELGCECERCNQARYHAYQALGNAEGRVALKAGDPGSA